MWILIVRHLRHSSNHHPDVNPHGSSLEGHGGTRLSCQLPASSHRSPSVHPVLTFLIHRFSDFFHLTILRLSARLLSPPLPRSFPYLSFTPSPSSTRSGWPPRYGPRRQGTPTCSRARGGRTARQRRQEPWRRTSRRAAASTCLGGRAAWARRACRRRWRCARPWTGTRRWSCRPTRHTPSPTASTSTSAAESPSRWRPRGWNCLCGGCRSTSRTREGSCRSSRARGTPRCVEARPAVLQSIRSRPAPSPISLLDVLVACVGGVFYWRRFLFEVKPSLSCLWPGAHSHVP